MASWFGTQCTFLVKLLIIIKNVGSGRPYVNQSSFMVKEPSEARTYAANTNVSKNLLTGPLSHHDTQLTKLNHF